jgi:hypothetical protein
MAYGIPEERIFLTGFPLPKKNLGSREKLEILKDDLFRRLVRLDPNLVFFALHRVPVEAHLERETPSLPQGKPAPLTLMFSVGGSGVQAAIAEKLLKSLGPAVEDGRLRILLSAGIRKGTYEYFVHQIAESGLRRHFNKGISIIYNKDPFRYFERFNALLRETDVLWTKPSELSFYCALGIPIITAPAVGFHERLNRQWLLDTHAAIKPGPVEYAHQWLFDMRDNGILAEAAWDGFLKGRKTGTWKIEELITKGSFTAGDTPLER